jgi:hypothetical protein
MPSKRKNIIAPEKSDFKDRVSTWMQSVLQRTVYSKPLKQELILILEDLFKMYSPTGSEDEVVEYCISTLKKAGFLVHTDAVKNVYAARGVDGHKLVCINAHTDTVQGKEDADIAKYVQYRWLDDVFTGNGKMLGGDDKCGIAVALTLAVHTNLPMKIIFTASEEIGGKGAEALTSGDFNNILCCFTIDRRGGNDLISEYCGRTCAPKEFVDAFNVISQRSANLKFVDVGGSYADTYVISQYTPCVNLSAGYYNAHTSTDFVDVNELYTVMIAVKAAIENASELELAIASAPMDWRHDKFAGNPNYHRGKYIYPTTYTFGGGFGTDWEYEYLGTPSVQGVKKPKHHQKIPKITGQKCRVKYKNLGRDDFVSGKSGSPTVQTDIEGHLTSSIMSYDEGRLLAQYNDFKISDGDWDDMLMDGRIQPFVHRIGINGRAKYRHAITGELTVEEKHARMREALSTLKQSHRETSLFEGYEQGEGEEVPSFDAEGREIIRDARDDYIDRDAIEDIEDLGVKSGYMVGTVEHSIFVDFITGAISVSDLTSYLEQGLISEWFYDNAKESRIEYEADLRMQHMREVYEEEKQEESEYTANKRISAGFINGVDTQYVINTTPSKEKLMVVKYAMGNTTPENWRYLFDEGVIDNFTYTLGLQVRAYFKEYGKMLNNYGEGLIPDTKPAQSCKRCDDKIETLSIKDKRAIVDLALGLTTLNMWTDLYTNRVISKSVYRAGINERNYYDSHGTLSGRFVIRDNYKHNYDDNPKYPRDEWEGA